MADPLLPNLAAFDPDEDDNVVDFVTGRRLAAQSAANQGLDGSADDAARAEEIGHATGQNSALIYGDLENYERQHKAVLTSELLKDNEVLRNYALAHPLNAVVSQNDWAQLHTVSGAIKRFGGSLVQPFIDQTKAGIEGFKEGFGDEPIGSSVPDATKNFRTDFPTLWNLFGADITDITKGSELFSRTFAGSMGAVYNGLIKAGTNLGIPENRAEYFARSVMGAAEAEMTRQMGEGPMPHQQLNEAITKQLHGVANAVKPFVDSGKPPPAGLHPLVDEFHKEQIKLDIDNLDDINAESNKSQTKEIAPQAFERFLDQHPEMSRTAGITMEGIDKVYPEGKIPEAGDGLLGDVPGLAEKIERARTRGGDVDVPLRSLAMAEPETYKELRDFIRTRPEGMTLQQATAPMVWEDLGRGPEMGPEMVDPEKAAQHVVLLPETAKEGPEISTITGAGGRLNIYKAKHVFPVKDVLEKIDPSFMNPPTRMLYKFFKDRIAQDPNVANVPVHVIEGDWENVSKISRSGSAYAFNDPNAGPLGRIVIPEELVNGGVPIGRATHVLMEEASHAATTNAIFQNPEIRQQVELLRAHTRGKLADLDPDFADQFSYALRDPYEFVAWARSHPGFQRGLMRVPLDSVIRQQLGFGQNIKSVWEGVRDIIRRVLREWAGKPVPENVMDALFRVGQQIDEYNRSVRGGMPPEFHAASRAYGTEPIDPKAMGINKQEQAKLLDMILKEASGDQEFTRKQVEREARTKLTAEWKENEKEVRKTVTGELQGRPDILADRLLREGRIGNNDVRRIRLDGTKLSDEQKAQLSEEHYGARGYDPDALANQFGYHSGKHMVDALARLEDERKLEGLTPQAHFNQIRDAEVEKRMQVKYGKLEENIVSEAVEHLLGPNTMDRMHEEYVRQGMKTGATPLKKEDVAAIAKEDIRSTKVGEIDSRKILAEAGRLQEKARREILTGSPTEAYKLLQQRQIQANIAKEAMKYEKERARSDRLNKTASARVVPGVEEEWTNWLHHSLIKGGVTVKRRDADLAERTAKYKHESFLSFAKEQAEKFYTPMDLPDSAFDAGWRKPQDEMTLDEWRDWAQTNRTLYNYGKNANTYEVGKDKRNLEEHRDRLITQMEKEKFTKTIPYSPNKSKLKNLTEDVKRIFHSLIWMESVWNRLDHGNPYGLANRSFSYRFSSAVNQYSVWVKDFSKQLEGLRKFDTNLRKGVDPIFVHPDTQEPIRLNKENVRQTIMYLGTKSGENKVIRGWMLPERYSEQDYEMAKQRLYSWLQTNSDKSDWDFAEGLGKVNEGIFEKYESMVMDRGGVPAQKVELNPISIHGKNYDGWYNKLIYDTEVRGTSKKLMGLTFDPDDAMGDSNFFKASTPRSHEKERTGYAGPLYLKLDRNAAAMSNVLRDAAIRPVLADASKLFYDKKFLNSVTRYMGQHVAEMLHPYLQSVAGMGSKMSAAESAGNRMIDYFSRNTVARLIGWNIHTIEKHTLSAAVNSLAEVGARAIAREWWNTDRRGDLHPTMSNEEFAMSQSHELRRRVQNALETMGGQFEQLRGEKGRWRDWLAEKGAAPIAYFDLQSATPTWIAAYKQSKVKQIAETGDVDYGLATDIADRAVRRAHGSSAISTRPEAMRGGAMARTMTRLYSFFNSMFQRNYEAMWRTKAGVAGLIKGDKEQGARDLSVAVKLLVAANAMPALIEELVTPYPSSRDDNWGEWTGKMLLMGMSGMIPGVREAVHAWVGGYASSLGILDTGMKDMADFVSRLRHGQAFDNEHGGKTLKEFNSILGTLTGRTNDEIGRTIKWMWDATHQSRETPRNLGEHLKDITTGKPREKKP